jgi:hypothetical protein
MAARRAWKVSFCLDQGGEILGRVRFIYAVKQCPSHLDQASLCIFQWNSWTRRNDGVFLPLRQQVRREHALGWR